jgi:hypothetical protein
MPNIKKLLVCQTLVINPSFFLKNCLNCLTGVYRFIKLFFQYTSYEVSYIANSSIPK